MKTNTQAPQSDVYNFLKKSSEDFLKDNTKLMLSALDVDPIITPKTIPSPTTTLQWLLDDKVEEEARKRVLQGLLANNLVVSKKAESLKNEIAAAETSHMAIINNLKGENAQLVALNAQLVDENTELVRSSYQKETHLKLENKPDNRANIERYAPETDDLEMRLLEIEREVANYSTQPISCNVVKPSLTDDLIYYGGIAAVAAVGTMAGMAAYSWITGESKDEY